MPKRNLSLNKQSGSLLIESLIVIAVLSILIYAAVPNIRDIMLKQDLQSAQASLNHTLSKAKAIANARNTFIDITIENHQVTLQPRDNKNQQIFKLPKRIQITEESQLAIAPTGLLLNPNGEILEQKIIIMQPKNADATDQSSRLVINSSGMISSL